MRVGCGGCFLPLLYERWHVEDGLAACISEVERHLPAILKRCWIECRFDNR